MLLVMYGNAANDDVTWQPAIVYDIQWGRWRTMSGLCRNIKRETLKTRGGHHGHRDCRNRHDCWNRCARGDLRIRQPARRRCWPTQRVEFRARLEDVVHAKQFPHALREVWVEMTVEDCVAWSLATISGSAVRDLGRERVTRSERLAVQHGRVVALGCVQPLMRVQ